MKFSTTVLLLVACSFCLYNGSSAAVEELPLKLLQTLKDLRPVEVYEHEAMADEIPEHEAMADDIPEHEAMADDIPEHEAMADDLPIEDEVFEHESMADVKPEPRAAACSVNIRGGIQDPSPVYLKTDSTEFYPFSNTAVMEFNSGASFQMYCPDKFTSFSSTLLTATCVSGTTFKVSGTNYDFKEFVCKSWPAFTVQKTGSSCNGGILLRVGFAVTSSRFAETMQICFNEKEEVTRYVRHTLNPASDYQQTGVDRITFQTQGFFGGKNVDKLYTQNTQMETINGELGVSNDKYFNSASNIFLARGHMGGKADFVYGTQQRATFVFVNVAPQWQSFNAGNWARVEDGLRSWVTKNKMNVNCYTGVHGVTTLANSKGVQTPLYLYYDNNHNGLIPVPMIYFRVVIEPSTNRGIVFVGVNNPHLTLAQIQKDYILCNDVSDKVTYINWKKTDITTGYSYACEVAEFLKKVPYLPALTAKGGLLV